MVPSTQTTLHAASAPENACFGPLDLTLDGLSIGEIATGLRWWGCLAVEVPAFHRPNDSTMEATENSA